MEARKSARERLLELPEIFSVAELAMLMNCERMEASTYLHRWRNAGLVKGLGGKSGVFMNQVLKPAGDDSGLLWERAVLKAMRSACIGGHEVLVESGLSTQITHQRYLLVSNTDSMYEIDGAEVHRRPVPWLNRLVREGGLDLTHVGTLLPRLTPGAALADLALYGDRKPDPDDLDVEAVDPAEVQLFHRLARGSALADQLGPPKARRRGLRP